MEWTEIIGIPEPTWGVSQESIALSGLQYNFVYSSGLMDYPIGPNGPYTHYIDPQHPNSDDTVITNYYGTHEKPRKSWYGMTNLASGSIVEIHNYNFTGGRFSGNGTENLPIFIRGFNCISASGTTFSIDGNYYILEDLVFDMGDYSRNAISFGNDDPANREVRYCSIRNCEFKNLDHDASSGSRAMMKIENVNPSGLSINNIIINNCSFHHCGEDNEGSNDISGIFCAEKSQYIWIVNSEFYLLGGDGIQCNSDTDDTGLWLPHHIYIGNNTFHDIYENAIDLKQSHDIIISKNTAYNFGEGYAAIWKNETSSPPFRYGQWDIDTSGTYRRNIWSLCNTVHNFYAQDGALLAYNAVGEAPSDEIYFVGNLVYNGSAPSGTGYASTAFGGWNNKNVYLINNTVHNVDRHFSFKVDGYQNPIPSAVLIVENNIFGNLNQSSQSEYDFVIYGSDEGLSDSKFYNNIFYNSNDDVQFRWGTYAPGPGVTYTVYTYDDLVNSGVLIDCLNSDPQFFDQNNNNFKLAIDSAARESGYRHDIYDKFFNLYGLDIYKDINNTIIPSGLLFDIGAYSRFNPLTKYFVYFQNGNINIIAQNQ